jgi:DNA-binding SARP family transcriptional activator
MIRLSLLGMPVIERDGERISVPRRKAVALLSFLAVEKKSYTREYLAALLWPNASQSRGLGSLRVELHALNRVLGNGFLQLTESDVQFDGNGSFVLDLDDIDTACRAPTIDSLKRAMELYHGPFMAGFTVKAGVEFDDWVSTQSASVNLRLGMALTGLIRTACEEKRYDDVHREPGSFTEPLPGTRENPRE